MINFISPNDVPVRMDYEKLERITQEVNNIVIHSINDEVSEFVKRFIDQRLSPVEKKFLYDGYKDAGWEEVKVYNKINDQDTVMDVLVITLKGRITRRSIGE